VTALEQGSRSVLDERPGSPRRSARDVTQGVLGSAGPAGLGWVIGLSAAVGLMASRSEALATLHLLVTFAVLGAACLRARGPAPILGITAYAGLCDVFWRMTGASGPYEGAKYALLIGFGAVLLRFVRRPRRPGLPILLILLLIPGAVLGTLVLGAGAAREQLVANLAGPVALALGVLACVNIRVTDRSTRYLYLVSLGPCISVATVATAATVTAADLRFEDSSNFVASGGFGPVQVSSLLSFGGLLCILLLLQAGTTLRMRLLLLATAVWLVGQAVLTFSRGGLFSLVLSVSCVGIASLTVGGQRVRVLVLAVVLGMAGLQILTVAGVFTGGASDERYASTDTTNRGDLAQADLQLFYEHPALGVGVGVSKTARDFNVEAAPHTEYTRLLAEHGVAGALAIVILVLLAIRAIRRGVGWYRLASVGLVIMSFAQMSHSATRIGAIAFGFTIAALNDGAAGSPRVLSAPHPPVTPRPSAVAGR